MKNSKPFAKHFLLVFGLLSTAFAGKGQNLVPNGDFEQYIGCPTATAQMDSCLFWRNPANTITGGTPDYFNQCANFSDVGVPGNIVGYQNANSGNAYCGIVAGRHQSPLSEWREYIETELTSVLTANTCYHFEMFLNLSNRSKYTSDAMGVYFSDTLINGINNWQSLSYIPQINFNLGFNTDTVNWINISGNYTASGGEAFIIIGNFKDSLQTNLLLCNSGGIFFYSYFYIDDVSLTPCTGIEEQNQNSSVTIYPNPVKDQLNITGLPGEEKQIIITDILGKEIYRTTPLTSDFRLPTSAFQKGIYFIEINTGKEVFRKKFLKE
jgi:hypothetical protein